VNCATQAESGLDPDFLYAAPDRAACAPLVKERRMEFANPAALHRKSGKMGHRPVRRDNGGRTAYKSIVKYLLRSPRAEEATKCCGNAGSLDTPAPV
jgi:hypothetical protein